MLDDVAIFDHALSAEEIGSVMGGDFAGFVIPEPSNALFVAVGFDAPPPLVKSASPVPAYLSASKSDSELLSSVLAMTAAPSGVG